MIWIALQQFFFCEYLRINSETIIFSRTDNDFITHISYWCMLKAKMLINVSFYGYANSTGSTKKFDFWFFRCFVRRGRKTWGPCFTRKKSQAATREAAMLYPPFWHGDCAPWRAAFWAAQQKRPDWEGRRVPGREESRFFWEIGFFGLRVKQVAARTSPDCRKASWTCAVIFGDFPESLWIERKWEVQKIQATYEVGGKTLPAKACWVLPGRRRLNRGGMGSCQITGMSAIRSFHEG